MTTNYENPLDHFNSYSTHYLLTVAKSTESLREMLGSTPGQVAPILANSLQAKGLGESFDVNGSKAYLLIDTRRFSQYSITDLDLSHVFGTGSRANPTAPASATTMTIIDSTGMTFFNMLMETFKEKLQSSQTSCFFLLTIFFVGHKDDGTTETVSQCFIPLMLMTIGWNFNASGSTYQLEFMETENAPARGGPLEYINYLGNVRAITTAASSTSKQQQFSNDIDGMCSALEYQLNLQSLGFYQKFVNTANQQAGTSGALTGKLVQYMITIPNEWKKFPISNAARSAYIEQKFIAKQSSYKADDEVKKENTLAQLEQSSSGYLQMSFAAATTVTDAVRNILESSEDILELMSEDKRKEGTAQSFKVTTNITCDDKTYLIHVDVFPYYLPKIPEETDTKNTKTIQSGSTNTITNSNKVKNLISYNYIFTGKNSHIIDLKIQYLPASVIALDTNLSLGKNTMAKRATDLANNKAESNTEAGKGQNKDTTASFNPFIRPGDPVFYPIISPDQRNNAGSLNHEAISMVEAVNSLKKKQDYSATFAELHFLGSTQTDMVIRGNPNLLKKYADRQSRGGMAPHSFNVDTSSLAGDGQHLAVDNLQLTNKELRSSKAEYYSKYFKPKLDAYNNPSNNPSDRLDNNIDPLILPVYVKLNIMAPNVDYAGNPREGEPLFTDKYFFNDPYRLIIVSSKFSGGEFTQTLTLLPEPQNGSDATSTPAIKSNS